MTSDSVELEKSQPFSSIEDNSLEGGKASKLSNILDSKKKSSKLKCKFSLYLEPRKISINQMYIEGLNEWLLSLEGNPTHLVSLLGDLFSQVDTVIRTTSGHLVNFENDILTIAYNTTINQNNHEEKAVASAQLLQEKLTNVKENKWRESGLLREEICELINFRFAICAQKTFCGNIGTKDIKHFTIFSSTRHNLDQIIRFGKKLKVPIIITQHIKQYCHTRCETRFLDRRELREDYFFSSLDDFNQENWEIGSVSMSNSLTKDCLLYELGDSIEMKQETDDGKFEEAIPLFREYQQVNPNDLPTQHLLRLCEQQAQTPTLNILE
ncbi:predicted protein [Naegleria gruberi]|uniref:Predicted protein n=1 Tax=Naegleria gruberi TaxID=5762 RepID=D2W3A4_NAEGR|nr:uncharacterized protein NAEGRDRAFT_54379 [Naegleria gruberi]EFC36482.1 predicted protein [Naegleria gruberi]|eukprot:XP_002669226.1 predicted protein [Naegleria gruberi strain NEG-M]